MAELTKMKPNKKVKSSQKDANVQQVFKDITEEGKLMDFFNCKPAVAADASKFPKDAKKFPEGAKKIPEGAKKIPQDIKIDMKPLIGDLPANPDEVKQRKLIALYGETGKKGSEEVRTIRVARNTLMRYPLMDVLNVAEMLEDKSKMDLSLVSQFNVLVDRNKVSEMYKERFSDVAGVIAVNAMAIIVFAVGVIVISMFI